MINDHRRRGRESWADAPRRHRGDGLDIIFELGLCILLITPIFAVVLVVAIAVDNDELAQKSSRGHRHSLPTQHRSLGRFNALYS